MKKVLVPVLSLLLSVSSTTIGLAVTDEAHLVDLLIQAYPEISTAEIASFVDLGYGYGEIAIAAGLADLAGVSLSAVIAYAESGLSWGEIAILLEIDQGKFGQQVRQIFAQGQVKSRNSDLAREEALINALTMSRVREEASLQQSGQAVNVEYQNKEAEKVKTMEAAGEGTGKGSQGA